MKYYSFPAVIIASLFIICGFTAGSNNHSYSQLPDNVLFANEIISDFRIPSEGYYPEFIRNLKKNSRIQDSKTGEQKINQDWYSQVTESIKKDEYNISYSNELNAYQSPNRANNFRFVYNKDGFTVSPRTTKIPLFDANDKSILEEEKKYKTLPDWKIKFALTGYGREGNYFRFNGGDLLVFNNSAYIEDKNMKITYLNDEKGMRQDFIVNSKPAGNSENLVLKFRLDTKLKTEITPGGIKFLDRSNSVVMQYSSLFVTDAEGKELKAEFVKINSKEYNITVDDKNAVYPVTVDPIVGRLWQIYGDQTNAWLGKSVATAGDVNGDGYSDIIIGAPLYDNGQTDEGKAWVFYGSPTGPSSVADWTAESNQASAYFGWSVSTAGDVNGDGYSDILIGSRYYDNGQTDEGKAFLYQGSNTGLLPDANWSNESNTADAQYGYCVSTAGDVNGDGFSDIIICQYSWITYVYFGSASGLPLNANWSLSFGNIASTAGDINGDGFSDIVISGRIEYQFNWRNPVRIYTGSSGGLVFSATIPYPSSNTSTMFGYSVSTAGDVNGDGYSDVIVGAPEQLGNLAHAYLYNGSASGINTSFSWSIRGDSTYGAGNGYGIGASVSTAGDVDGDGFSDVAVGGNEAFFVFNGSSSGLRSTQIYTDNFGAAEIFQHVVVSTAGDINGDGFSDVIVGINSELSSKGRGCLYIGGGYGINSINYWAAESNQSESDFGISVSTAGDVNGDGFSDVIIGSHNFDNGQTDEGRAFVYHGSLSGLSSTANWTAESDQAGANFGFSVSTAGDVNGDGFSDVIVGARTFDNGETDEGRVFVYLGSSSGLSSNANWFAESNQQGAEFGWSVSTAGDVNGDGFSDIIVGAYLYDNGQTNEGKVYVYHGKASNWSSIASWVTESNQAEAFMGYSVSCAGDVNGDGFSDIIIGAPYYDLGEMDEGRVFVYHGSKNGLSNLNWSAQSNQVSAELGYSVSGAGDVNCDGLSDIIVGAPFYDTIFADVGKVFIYQGSQTGLKSSYSWSQYGSPSSTYGCSVSTAGDVNNDGYSDVLIGAKTYTNGQTGEGMVCLFYNIGGSSYMSTRFLECNQDNAGFGVSVSTAGDINGDGFSDIIIGANNYDNVEVNEGKVFVYYGSSGSVLRSTVQQYKPNTSTIIPPLGLSGTIGSVKLSQFTKSSFGRADCKLVWELKKDGEPFSGPNSVSYTGMQSGYTDILLTGQTLSENIINITAGYDYKWRVRTKYSPVNNPYQVYGPWRYYTSYMPVPWGCFKAQDSPLPVELISFIHSVNKNDVILKWTTAKEINNKGFTIERFDIGKNDKWSETGFIEGKGNSNNPVSYEFTDKNILKGSYKYRLRQEDYNGNFEYHNLSQDVVIGVPEKFELTQNYPNPFNPVTKITFALPGDSRVTLKIYDITGREVKTLINGEVMTADWYTREFNSSGLASGVYFYRLTADGINKYTAVKKMMLIK